MSSRYRRLWLLIEGADDSRFCEAVVKPAFGTTYSHVATWEYSQRKPSERARFLRGIGLMNADYLLFGDIDERPCVTVTKETITNQFAGLTQDRIVVVRREIEAWYLAGLDEAAWRDLGLDRVRNVDEVTKEQFDRMVGGKVNHTSTMVDILECYDVEVARQRSPSFRYFWQKHVE